MNERMHARLMRNSDGDDNSVGCWNWTKGTNRRGYGRLNAYVCGRAVCLLAHRVSFAVFNAPEGVEWFDALPVDELDHLCVNPACINPDHLEPVTRGEQLRRRDDRRRAAAVAYAL